MSLLYADQPRIWFQTGAAWAFQKDSPYLELFNHHLSLLVGSGVADRLMHKQMEEKPATPCATTSTITAVSIESTVAAFVVLIAGAVASVGAFCFELIRANFRPKWVSQQHKKILR